MVNKSGLRPLGVAVLVEPYEPTFKKGLIVMPDTLREKEKMLETRATVIEVGPLAWAEEKFPRAAVGDKVLIAKFAGVMAQGTLDGKQYRIVNDRDIYCRIEE